MKNNISALKYCKKVFDGTHDTPIPSKFGSPLITSKHIIGSTSLDLANTYCISDKDYQKIQKRSAVSKWDVLFSMIGSVGEIYLEKNEDIPYAIKNIGVFSCDDEYKAKWLYYYFKSPFAKKVISNYLNGAVQKFLPLEFLRDFPITPYEKSKKIIIDFLFNLDSKIEVNNKINTELEQIARILFDYWFVQFDFPDEEGKPYKTSGGEMEYNTLLKRDIPVNWTVVKLGEYISIKRGISYKSKEIGDEGLPMINLNSFNLDGTYKWNGLKYYSGNVNDEKLINTDDLLIATTDVTRRAEIIGKALVVPNIFNDSIVISCDIAKVEIDKILDKFYLELLFNSDYFHKYIKGFASGTMVLHLDVAGIEMYECVVPPEWLLKKYASIKKVIECKKSLILKENEELIKIRDFLLPLLMNGQVKIK